MRIILSTKNAKTGIEVFKLSFYLYKTYTCLFTKGADNSSNSSIAESTRLLDGYMYGFKMNASLLKNPLLKTTLYYDGAELKSSDSKKLLNFFGWNVTVRSDVRKNPSLHEVAEMKITTYF